MSKYIYKCTNCKETFVNDGVIYVCPKCYKPDDKSDPPKGILKVNYDFEEIIKKIKENEKVYDFFEEAKEDSKNLEKIIIISWH